jgi:hypothetical protein
MKLVWWIALSLPLVLVGCGVAKNRAARRLEAEAQIAENLAKLSPDDQRLAEVLKKCPVAGNPLGSMGTPVKVTVNGEPVFVCCGVCENRALADPDATLAKVKELKEKGDTPAK